MEQANWLVWTAVALGIISSAFRSVANPNSLPVAVLTNAAQVHALPAAVAGQNLPVRLEGVVTHYHAQHSDGISFQDSSDGVYIRLQGLKPDVRVGDRVVIEGKTAEGDYAPIVLLRQLRKLGRGELPTPERVTAAALATGRYDSRRVEVRGIVRSAAAAQRTISAQTHLAMELRSDGNDLLVRVTEYSPASTNLVDAEVIVRGTAAGVFSWQRQLLAPIVVAATEQLRESQLEVRRSVWNLRSVKLEEATLPEALQQLGRALADSHGPVVEVLCEGQPMHVPPGAASHLFRVAQEGITNALKHAQARKIEIVLTFSPESVELRVNDDGCGFDTAAAAVNGHFGLRGLRERARALEAELTLDSTPGQGTRLRLTVPASRLKET